MARILNFPDQEHIKQEQQEWNKTDGQVFDAIELLLEYAHECGNSLDPVLDSQELGDLIKSLHIFFGKMNGVNPSYLNWEKTIDISELYNDKGYLASVDKEEE
tara:strand:- start:28 stop:336 length:309 start_codon:yes stop_codon:yes gene_type:complete